MSSTSTRMNSSACSRIRLGDAAQRRRALGRRQPRPGALVERAPRGGDRVVDVGRLPVGHDRDDLVGGRAARLERPARATRAERAVDVVTLQRQRLVPVERDRGRCLFLSHAVGLPGHGGAGAPADHIYFLIESSRPSCSIRSAATRTITRCSPRPETRAAPGLHVAHRERVDVLVRALVDERRAPVDGQPAVEVARRRRSPPRRADRPAGGAPWRAREPC